MKKFNILLIGFFLWPIEQDKGNSGICKIFQEMSCIQELPFITQNRETVILDTNGLISNCRIIQRTSAFEIIKEKPSNGKDINMVFLDSFRAVKYFDETAYALYFSSRNFPSEMEFIISFSEKEINIINFKYLTDTVD